MICIGIMIYIIPYWLNHDTHRNFDVYSYIGLIMINIGIIRYFHIFLIMINKVIMIYIYIVNTYSITITEAFLSRNQFRNLSYNILAGFMVYRASYRNIDRFAFLYGYIVRIPSENLS